MLLGLGRCCCWSAPAGRTTPIAEPRPRPRAPHSPSAPSASPSATPSKVTPSNELRQDHRHRRLRQGAQGRDQGAVGDRQDPDRGTESQSERPGGQAGRRPSRSTTPAYNGRTGQEVRRLVQPRQHRAVQPRPGGSRLQEGPARAAPGQPGAGRDARPGRLRRRRVATPTSAFEVGDTLVFVVDIVAVPADRARRHAGHAEERPADRHRQGRQAQITIPKSDPPSELQIQPLIKGKGKKVAETDTITFNYLLADLERRQGGRADLQLQARHRAVVRAVAGPGEGADRADRRQPGAAGHPAGPGLSRRQRHAEIGKGETLVFVVDLLFSQSQ